MTATAAADARPPALDDIPLASLGRRHRVWRLLRLKATAARANRDIADRLFISRATVKTHLTHVFTKLDITNRAQLTALVTRATAESTRGRG